MECDNEGTRVTNKLYNPANISEAIKKCDTDTPFEYAERDLIKKALEIYQFIGSKENLVDILDRFKTRMIDLRKNTDMYIEPHYWEKEIYALGELEYVLYGKDITSEYMIKMGKDEKEEEER
jgi:hypothetical protein